MTFKRLLSVAVLVGIACATPMAQAHDSLLGTWKLNTDEVEGPSRAGRVSSRRQVTGSRLPLTRPLRTAPPTTTRSPRSTTARTRRSPGQPIR